MTKRMMSAVFEEPLEGFPGIVQIYREEYDEDGNVSDRLHDQLRAKEGTEFISGNGACTEKAGHSSIYVWIPSLIKNDNGEWMIYAARGRRFDIDPINADTIELHRIHPAMLAATDDDKYRFDSLGSKLDSVIKELAKKSAFVTVSGAYTFLVVGKSIVRLGCSEGFDMLLNLQVISEDGSVCSEKELSISELRNLIDYMHPGLFTEIILAVDKA